MMKYTNGDYVITGVQNAFNDKISFWISKKGSVLSFYCFSEMPFRTEQEAETQLKHGWSQYITYYEAMSAMNEAIPSYRLGETIFDMTLNAAQYIERLRAENRCPEFDSRDLYGSIYAWAAEFEGTDAAKGEDYLEAVDTFATEKLNEYFDVKEDGQ